MEADPIASRPRPIPGGWRDVAGALDRVLSERPDAEALVARDARLSFRELDAAVNAAAAALRELGVRQGDRVAATLPNQTELVIAFLAAQRLGAVWLGVNRALAAPEKIYQLQDCGAVVYLADGPAAEQVGAARGELPALEHIVDADPGNPANAWKSLVGRHAGAPRPDVVIDPHAPAAIAYTSGTTGRPKGAVHSQHNMMVVAASGHAGLRGGQWAQPLRVGVYLPLTILNLMVLDVIPALSGGGACVCIDRADAVGVAEWIEAGQVHAMSSAPATIFDLVSKPEVTPAQLASLKFVACGGALVPDELIAGFAAKFGKPMYQGYGLTEAPSAVAGHLPERKAAPGSCGFAYGHVRIAMLDAEGREAPRGETGELCIRAVDDGPWAGVYTPMLGYWGRPEESAASLRGGWLHTGDAAAIDETGDIFIRDRLKELIIRGGSNIYPAEVERVLKLDPRVRDAAVVGKPDTRLGELVAAFVELVPGASADGLEAELKAACLRELAKYKAPEVWVFVEEMPRNAMNKIVKPQLKSLYFESA